MARAEVDYEREEEMTGEKGIRIQGCVSEGQIVTLPVRGSPVAFHCSEVRSFFTSPMHSYMAASTKTRSWLVHTQKCMASVPLAEVQKSSNQQHYL